MSIATQGVTDSNQATTQNPQIPAAGNGLSAPSTDNLQSVSTSNLLSGGNGIQLGNTNLNTVSLDTVSAATGTDAKQTIQHHVMNPLLIVVLVIVVIAAIGFFISATRSAKNTTY